MNCTIKFFLAFFFIFNFIFSQANNPFKIDKDSASEFLESKIDTGEFLVDNNGLKIWYKVSGQGPLCILPTPGWGPGSELYYNSINRLEELFTMVYVDTRGTGKSDRPDLEQYTTSNILSDIEAVRKDIGIDKVWLIGHSKGGAMVLTYAHEHKDNVDGVIIIGSSGGLNIPPELMQNAIKQRQDEPWFASAAEYFSREPRDENDWITGTKAIIPMYFTTVENFEKSKDVFANINLSYDAFKAQNNWYDCENNLNPKLPEIELPVLVVVGMDDFICGPYVANYLHRELPNSKLLPINNAGHFPWMEQSDLFFNGIKEYLPKLKQDNTL